MHEKLNPQAGITLVESVIALGIFGIALTATYSFYFFGWEVRDRNFEQIITVENTRKAMEGVVVDIRGLRPAETGAYGIESASEQSFVFFNDIDYDDRIERVRYFLSGSELRRGVIEPASNPVNYSGAETITVVVDNVVNGADPVFYYYDEDYAGGAEPSPTSTPLPEPTDWDAVRLVTIFISVDKSPGEDPPAFDLSTEVMLRSYKDNL